MQLKLKCLNNITDDQNILKRSADSVDQLEPFLSLSCLFFFL